MHRMAEVARGEHAQQSKADLLRQASDKRTGNPEFSWSSVAGPAATLDTSLQRIGWHANAGHLLVDDEGFGFDLTADPPCVVVQAMNRSVRRWRLREIAIDQPHVIPRLPGISVHTDRSGTTPQQHRTVVVGFPQALDSLITYRAKISCDVFVL